VDQVNQDLPSPRINPLHLADVTGKVTARDERGKDALVEAAARSFGHGLGGEQRRARPLGDDDVAQTQRG
jgi:hypothetical protein